jgi:predicted kinase
MFIYISNWPSEDNASSTLLKAQLIVKGVRDFRTARNGTEADCANFFILQTRAFRFDGFSTTRRGFPMVRFTFPT